MSEDILVNIEISPREVHELIQRGEKFMFVDVREKWEFDTSRIAGAELIPLREVQGNVARFEEADQIVLFCHHGMRSLDAAAWLRAQGIASVRSMAGGIDRWAAEIDPKLPRY
ncbi:MAG: rhodanese-like domain-containing protein [Candidatus Acidiferrales bacterium]